MKGDLKGAVIAKPNLSLPPEAEARLRSILSQFDTLYVLPEFMGSPFCAGLANVEELPKLPECGYTERFAHLVAILADRKCDVVVTVGGDGTASYIASQIVEQDAGMRILGFPAGTANVGPIVQDGLDADSLSHSFTPDAVRVTDGDRVLGYGFNDVIIARTFLGTLDGKMVNLSARKMADEGRAMVDNDIDRPIVSKDFRLTVNGKAKHPSMEPEGIMQICICPMKGERLYGRAVYGALGNASYMEHPVGIALMDRIAVDAREENWNVTDFSKSAHLCVGEGEKIEMTGLSEEACVIIDGNPFVPTSGRLGLEIKANAVSACTDKERI